MADIGIGSSRAHRGPKSQRSGFMSRTISSPLRRTEGGQHRYEGHGALVNVNKIRQLLMLSDPPTMSCDKAEGIARHHLQQVEAKIIRLRRIRSELKRMIEAC
jgi:MerR-like DNA binding protein